MKLEIHLQTMWTNNTRVPVLKILFLLLYFAAVRVYAFNTAIKTGNVVQYDSETVSLKKIPPTELTTLHNDSDYDYAISKEEPKSLWDRFWEWLWNQIGELFNGKSTSITIRIIRYVFIIAIISVIIYLLFKNNVRALFYGKSASLSSDFTETLEEIREMDFAKRIAEEVSNRNFRKAVRLYFLKILKELNQENLISWKQDKTNADYQKELRKTPYDKQFGELSRLYEYIWYGDFKLDEADFLEVIQKFNQFKINQPA